MEDFPAMFDAQRTPHWLIALALFVASAINGGIAPKFLKNGATWKHATMAFEETLGVREISAALTPIHNCLYEKKWGVSWMEIPQNAWFVQEHPIKMDDN